MHLNPIVQIPPTQGKRRMAHVQTGTLAYLLGTVIRPFHFYKS